MERTLAILKPDALEKGLVGELLKRIEGEGFQIRAMRMTQLSRRDAETFYAVHKGKHFFDELIAYMTAGPCIPLILERDDAIQHWRTVLEKAREELPTTKTQNLAHGSDAPETAEFESRFLFAGCDVYA